MLVTNPRIQEEIGLSDREKAAVKDVFRATGEAELRAMRESYEKLLALLTPEQREKLRQELDQQVCR